MTRAAGTIAGLLVAMTALLGSAGGGVAGAQEAEGESTPVEAGEAIGDEQVVVADGHVDIGPRFLEDGFTLLVRDDTVEPSVWRHLPDVVLQATDAATVQVPDDPAFSFLGQAGARVWLLPQVQQPGILWPGWNTQDPEVATTVAREVTWTLTGVDGPGTFVLFVTGDFGEPATIFDSSDPSPQETGIDTTTHAHGNWVFTEPGIYRVAMAMSATTLDGEEVTTSGTLQVAVGDTTDPRDAFAAGQAGEGAASPASSEAPEARPGGGDRPAGSGEEGDDQDTAPASPGDDGSVGPWLVLGAAALAGVAAVVVAARSRRRRSAAPAGDAGTDAAPPDERSAHAPGEPAGPAGPAAPQGEA